MIIRVYEDNIFYLNNRRKLSGVAEKIPWPINSRSHKMFFLLPSGEEEERKGKQVFKDAFEKSMRDCVYIWRVEEIPGVSVVLYYKFNRVSVLPGKSRATFETYRLRYASDTRSYVSGSWQR